MKKKKYKPAGGARGAVVGGSVQGSGIKKSAISPALKVNLKSEIGRFGLSVRVGGQLLPLFHFSRGQSIRAAALATRKREFKLPWREAGPPNHHEDTVDSDQ